MPVKTRRVLLAKPRGYCAGVDRAVQTVEVALELYGPPVYVRKQIVHNSHVVASLEARGAVFVEEAEEVPEGAVVVFSAHGVAPQVREDARKRGLRTIDATCPLVTKVHNEARRFPELVDPPSDDICYATQNRQAAVKAIAGESDLVLVVGSRNSSNSVRLVEVARDGGAGAAYLVDDASALRPEWLEGVTTVGLTSGASVPEDLVEGMLARLAESGFDHVEEVEAVPERMQFALPYELRKKKADRGN